MAVISSGEGCSDSGAVMIVLMISARQVSNIHFVLGEKLTLFASPLSWRLDVMAIDPLQEPITLEVFNLELIVTQALETLDSQSHEK